MTSHANPQSPSKKATHKNQFGNDNDDASIDMLGEIGMSRESIDEMDIDGDGDHLNYNSNSIESQRQILFDPPPIYSNANEMQNSPVHSMVNARSSFANNVELLGNIADDGDRHTSNEYPNWPQQETNCWCPVKEDLSDDDMMLDIDNYQSDSQSPQQLEEEEEEEEEEKETLRQQQKQQQRQVQSPRYNSANEARGFWSQCCGIKR
jgi:hypothetical protein